MLKDHIDNVLELLEDTPEFISRWLKHEANQFHDGARYTPAESMKDAVAADAFWESYRLDKNRNITVKNCPPQGELSYQRLRAKTIMEYFPDRWKT